MNKEIDILKPQDLTQRRKIKNAEGIHCDFPLRSLDSLGALCVERLSLSGEK